MAKEKTQKQIATMMSQCVSCDMCKIKDKCDAVKVRPKSSNLCLNMWLKWLQGEFD